MWLRLIPAFLFLIANFVLGVSAQAADTNTTSIARVGCSWVPNDRNTTSLLQSCVITLLSCTWTVIHLNIPAPHESRFSFFKRKLKWTVLTLIAPEITCSIALRQWEESRAIVEEMKRRGVEWTLTHGFYATMGGYVLHHEGFKIPLLPSEIILLLDDLDQAPPFQLPPIKAIDIEDRSKASGFAKVFTLTQITWLVAQCIVRGAKHLPISELEVATIAFATCTIIANCFWWSKPLDVRMTTAVRYDGILPASLSSLASKGWKDRKSLQRVKMTTRIIRRGSRRSMFFNLVLPLFLFSTAFSVVHLVAWDFDFATPREGCLWRTCSLIATLAPIIIAGSLQVASIWDTGVATDRSQKTIAAPEFAVLVILCYFLSILAYVVARVVLIFLVFYCLRSMPVGIYSSIPWLEFMPHV